MFIGIILKAVQDQLYILIAKFQLTCIFFKAIQIGNKMRSGQMGLWLKSFFFSGALFVGSHLFMSKDLKKNRD